MPVGQIEAGPFVNARGDSDGSSPSPGRELYILDKQADEKHSAANKLRSGWKTKRNHANKNNKGFEMSDATRDLFDRWERVWHEAQYDLISSCVGPNYIRHDENGDRTVTREAYAAELAGVQNDRPGIRVVVYDHSFMDDRAWFRFSFQWPDPKTGERQSRAGMQSYRIEDGKLVETWITMRPLGTTWADVPQERWTARRPD